MTDNPIARQHPVFLDYYITEGGEVYSNKHGKFTKLNPFVTNGSTLSIHLMHKGIRHHKTISKLIKETYQDEYP